MLGLIELTLRSLLLVALTVTIIGLIVVLDSDIPVLEPICFDLAKQILSQQR